MICGICGAKRSSMLCDKDIGHICHDCQNKLKINSNPWEELRSVDGIVLWIDVNSKVMSAWFDDGKTAIPQDVIDNLDMDLLDVFKWLRNKVKEGVSWCSRCNLTFPLSELKFSHFAGKYCDECAEQYKKDNSMKCGICGSPMYICSC